MGRAFRIDFLGGGARAAALAALLVSAVLACSGGESRVSEAAGGAIADSAEAVRPLAVGSEMPDVQVRDLTGRALPLRGLLGEDPVVLIFYRGGW